MGAGNGDDEADGDFEPRQDKSAGLDCINQMNLTTDSPRPISPLTLPVRNSLYFLPLTDSSLSRKASYESRNPAGRAR